MGIRRWFREVQGGRKWRAYIAAHPEWEYPNPPGFHDEVAPAYFFAIAVEYLADRPWATAEEAASFVQKDGDRWRESGAVQAQDPAAAMELTISNSSTTGKLKPGVYVVLACLARIGVVVDDVPDELIIQAADRLDGVVPTQIEDVDAANAWLEYQAQINGEEGRAVYEAVLLDVGRPILTAKGASEPPSPGDFTEEAAHLVPTASPQGGRGAVAHPIPEWIRERLRSRSSAVGVPELVKLLREGWILDNKDVDTIVMASLTAFGRQAATSRPLAADDEATCNSLTSLAAVGYQLGRLLLGSSERPALYSWQSESAAGEKDHLEERSRSYDAAELFQLAGPSLEALLTWLREHGKRPGGMAFVADDVAVGYFTLAVGTGLALAVSEADLHGVS